MPHAVEVESSKHWTARKLPGIISFKRDLEFSSLFSRGGNGTPLQYSCLENPMDGGAWEAAVHGVAESQT